MISKVQTYPSARYGPTVGLNLELGEVKATFGCGPDKLVLVGRLSLNDVYTDKYQRRECQLQVYAPKGSARRALRNSDVWDRCEIFLTHDDLDALIEGLLKIKLGMRG